MNFEQSDLRLASFWPSKPSNWHIAIAHQACDKRAFAMTLQGSNDAIAATRPAWVGVAGRACGRGWSDFVANPNLPDYQPPARLNYLDQWSEADRQTYYTLQGTQIKGLEYDWLRALELPCSRDRFAIPNYLARFGFLVDPAQRATALKPGNLPVGFARHEDAETGRAYLDVTCAGCHTGALRYGGQAIRIDGGAAITAYGMAASTSTKARVLHSTSRACAVSPTEK